MRNPIQRARGRAIRVAGLPNLPNLPSGRALAQNELRSTIRVPSRAGGSGSSSNDVPGDDDGSGGDVRPCRRASRPRRGGGITGLVGLVSIALTTYLLAMSCGTHPTEYRPHVDTCAERVVYEHIQLSDC